jgi:hypothetical protein
MFAFGNDIPFLASGTIARNHLNGDKIVAEIARATRSLEAFSTGSLLKDTEWVSRYIA